MTDGGDHSLELAGGVTPHEWVDAGAASDSRTATGGPAAIEYSAAAVGVKIGYDEVAWDESAKLIWSSSLKQDNTLLCRLVVAGPSPNAAMARF